MVFQVARAAPAALAAALRRVAKRDTGLTIDPYFQLAGKVDDEKENPMSTLEAAIRIAVTAHAGQVDKDGAAYITHPLRLMAAVDGEEAKIVAVLHDVIEDTTVTLEDLRREGFSDNVLTAVACVTHRREEPYTNYVVRCKSHPVARQVKLADLADNSRPDRCILRVEGLARDLVRIHRYLLSYKFLTDRLSEPDYRSLMRLHGELEGGGANPELPDHGQE